jgi:hypothetical protein
MDNAYQLTYHAAQRITQRRISPEEVLNAMHKRGRIQIDGTVSHYDPMSGVVVVTNAEKRAIITIYRARRRRQKGL